MGSRSTAVLAACLVLAVSVAPGCGGDEAPVGEDGGDGEYLVAALGDSITAGTPGYDPGALGGEARGDERSSYGYWAERAEPELDVRNCGVPGERTDEIAARLEDCAEGAEALIVQGGTNDLGGGRQVDAIAAELRAMVRRGRELGLEVALADVLPAGSGPRFGAEIERLNRAIAEIGEQEDVTVLGFNELLADPRDPHRLAPRWAADPLHPSVSGHRRLGRLVARELAPG